MKLLAILLAVSAAALAQDAAAPPKPLPSQKIGPNDLIAVSVYNAPEFSRSLRVSPEGEIRLPMVRQRIAVAGLSVAKIEDAIAAALSGEQILVDPVVSVTVAEYHSRPIAVAGAVRNPVTFQADQPITLLEAITRAGGLSPEAGLEILVSYSQPAADGSATTLTRRIPAAGLLNGADPDLNLRLNGGEEVRVPEIGKVYVLGNVKAPGAFPVQGDNDTTILRVLAMAQGLAPYSAKEAYIIRMDDRTGKKNELPVPLDKIMKRKAPDVPLLANDIFYVPDNSGKRTRASILEKVAGFGAATATGMIIYGVAR